MLCSSARTVQSVMFFLAEVRHHFGSKLKILIMHCDEIPDNMIKLLESTSNVNVSNICDYSNDRNIFRLLHIAPTSQNQDIMYSRFRGFFCKPAALLLAEFTEVILADTDVLWFQNPELLFEAESYLKTGTIFFRDRLLYQKRSERNSGLNITHVKKYIEKYTGKLFTRRYAQAQLQNTFFWRNLVDPKHPPFQHIQESSVVVMNKFVHRRTVSVIRSILMKNDYHLGYGDKEIYWIAATIANLSFSFEPYLAGIYGDCGALFHYDPRDTHLRSPLPFYINAEYLVECITSLGEGLELVISNPIRVSLDLNLFTMDRANSRTNGCCGACRLMGCYPTPLFINQEIRKAQHFELNQTHRKVTECMLFRQRLSPYNFVNMVEDKAEDETPIEVLRKLDDMRRRVGHHHELEERKDSSPDIPVAK